MIDEAFKEVDLNLRLEKINSTSHMHRPYAESDCSFRWSISDCLIRQITYISDRIPR